MNDILLIVLMVILMFITIQLIYKTTHFSGGEYKSIKMNHENMMTKIICPSVSQVVVNDLVRIKNKPDKYADSNKILDECISFLKQKESCTFNMQMGIIMNENKNKYISDECMDAILLTSISDDIFSVNEFQINNQSYGNQLLTFVTKHHIKELDNEIMKIKEEI